MNDKIKSLVPGHYDMTCAEKPELYTYWEFRPDGKAIQNDFEQGTWSVVDEVVVIAYHNKVHGHAVLTFDDDNTLLGENVWKNGKTFTWTLKRVNP